MSIFQSKYPWMESAQKDYEYRYLIIAAIVSYLCLGTAYLFYGHIHPDEGHYLLAGKLIYQGKIPYRDFQYVQSPLYPYIYGTFQLLFGSSLKAGRSISFILGFFTLIMTVRLAYKSHGSCAAAITAGLIGFNSFLIYCFTITKLFSLTAFLIVLSYSIWCSSRVSNIIRYNLSLVIMSLAVGVRISVLPGVAVLMIAILIAEWHRKDIIIFAALTTLGAMAIIFLPFYFLAPEQFLFYLIKYHGLRGSGNSANLLANKFYAMTGLIRDYFFPFLLTFFAIPAAFRMMRHDRRRIDIMTLTGIIVTVASIHLLSNNPYISFYLSIIFPLFAFLIGITLDELMQRVRNRQTNRSLAFSFLLCCFILLAVPTRSFTIPAFKTYPVKRIEELGGFVSNNTLVNDQVLTYNNAIAAAAARNVLSGTEMNSVAFTEDWPEDRCRKFSLINREMLLKSIRQKIPGVIILSKLSLSRSFPEFTPVLPEDQKFIFTTIARYYKLVKIFKKFGYTPNDETYVYLPKHVKPNTKHFVQF